MGGEELYLTLLCHCQNDYASTYVLGYLRWVYTFLNLRVPEVGVPVHTNTYVEGYLRWVHLHTQIPMLKGT